MQQKTIVITGSTRGIGLTMARNFLGLGHQVVINGRNENKVKETVSRLKETHPDVVGIPGNVSIDKTHDNLIDGAVSSFGKIDIWINNAGIPQPYKHIVDLDSELINKLIDTNINGLIIGSQKAAAQMIKQGYGKIFNMEGFGSDGRIMAKLGLYGTTKRAVSYFSKSFARELEDTPVQLGILSPGMVRTDFLDESIVSASPEEEKRFEKVNNILAEDVEIVSEFLVKEILKSSKNYDRIKYISRVGILIRLIKMSLK